MSPPVAVFRHCEDYLVLANETGTGALLHVYTHDMFPPLLLDVNHNLTRANWSYSVTLELYFVTCTSFSIFERPVRYRTTGHTDPTQRISVTNPALTQVAYRSGTKGSNEQISQQVHGIRVSSPRPHLTRRRQLKLGKNALRSHLHAFIS